MRFWQCEIRKSFVYNFIYYRIAICNLFLTLEIKFKQMKVFLKSVGLLFIVFISIQNRSFSQEELVYHYAYVADNDNKVLYISNMATVVFMEYFDWEKDEYLPIEIERQFVEFIEFKYDILVSEGSDFSYKMGETETEIAESRSKIVDKYLNEGFKVKKVKNFVYD